MSYINRAGKWVTKGSNLRPLSCEDSALLHPPTFLVDASGTQPAIFVTYPVRFIGGRSRYRTYDLCNACPVRSKYGQYRIWTCDPCNVNAVLYHWANCPWDLIGWKCNALPLSYAPLTKGGRVSWASHPYKSYLGYCSQYELPRQIKLILNIDF